MRCSAEFAFLLIASCFFAPSTANSQLTPENRQPHPVHGIALGDPIDKNFQLVATNDGGNSWNSISQISIPAAIEGEGAFAASGTCIAVQGKRNAWFVTGGKAARVFRSADRGHTWKAVEVAITHGDSAGVFSIAFRDRLHGAIAGGDYKKPDQGGANIALTDDGGAACGRASWKAWRCRWLFR